MPEGFLEVVGYLSLGYLLLVLELFVPGGILGILGAVSMVYGCYLAFGLSTLWGVGSVGFSLMVTVAAMAFFLRSKTAKRMVLDSPALRNAKAPSQDLEVLVGKEGVTLTQLRPSGIALIDEVRVDVVADNELVGSGARIRVVEIEGTRVVVEEIEGESALIEAPDLADLLRSDE